MDEGSVGAPENLDDITDDSEMDAAVVGSGDSSNSRSGDEVECRTERGDDLHTYNSFKLWLQSADRMGVLSRRSLQSNTSIRLRLLLVLLEKHHVHWISFARNPCRKSSLMVTQINKKFMPGTKKSYLSSLVHFGNTIC